jgi:hypothetical protein
LKTSRTSLGLGAAALAIVAGAWLPALGQDRPESLLPPGFNEPVPTPAPTAAPTRAPGTPPPVTSATPGFGPVPLPGAPTPSPTPTATPSPIDLARYELPDFAKRSLAEVGAVNEGAGLLGANAFGQSNGRTLETLMRRLDAPLPSRWLSIALRRALVSRLATPPGVNGADFAAERAWLLLRMGEADAARAVVQSVDVENYTPKLFQVAMQAMLANGDPAGLCPLVDLAVKGSAEPGWALARAMCAGLGAEPAKAGALLDAARRVSGRGIDYSLAEKVVGAGAQGRRSVTIEWDGVDRLTAWRFGLASATGVEIPDALYVGTAPAVQAWRATVPMTDVRARAAVSDYAASQGVLSNLALVDLFSEVEASDDSGSAEGAVARDLRSAYAEGTEDQRVQTLRELWNEPQTRRGKFARLVLTARAAARIAPTAERAEDGTRMISAMLSAGLDRGALRWRGVVPVASDGWAMLALADPARRLAAYGDVDAYRDRDTSPNHVKARMLLAGLTGLGRLSPEDAEALAQPLDVRFGAQNSWTRAITAAARRGEAGTVLLLTAVGMQTSDWRGVPPEMLYHAVSSLRAVGLEGEARMIAAEAIARL